MRDTIKWTLISGLALGCIYVAIVVFPGGSASSDLPSLLPSLQESGGVRASNDGEPFPQARLGGTGDGQGARVFGKWGAGTSDRLRAFDGPHPLRIQVDDSDGKPVSDAVVSAWSSEERERLGTTDGGGTLAVSLSSTGIVGLLVEKAGYASVRSYLEQPLPDDVRIQLRKGWSLAGHVLSASEKDLLAGVTVLAAPEGASPVRDLVRLASRGSSVWPSAISADDGSFRLDGLDLATTYYLEAAGGGFVLGKPLKVSAQSPADMELLMWRLYGLRLVVKDEAGNAPVVSERVDLASCTNSLNAEEAETASISRYSRTAMLLPELYADLPRRGESSLYSVVILNASPVTKDKLGPIRLKKCVPGYYPVMAEFSLLPIETGQAGLPVHELTVTPQTSFFGILEVELKGLDPARELYTAVEHIRYVFLRYGESGQELMFPLDVAARSDFIGVVPAGPVQVALAVEGWETPNWEQSIADLVLDEGVNTLTLDLSSWGGVQVELMGLGGMRASGPVAFELIDQESGRKLRTFHCDHAPYRLHGIEEGAYSLAVHHGYSPGVNQAHSSVFHVVPGRVFTVRCLPLENESR